MIFVMVGLWDTLNYVLIVITCLAFWPAALCTGPCAVSASRTSGSRPSNRMPVCMRNTPCVCAVLTQERHRNCTSWMGSICGPPLSFDLLPASWCDRTSPEGRNAARNRWRGCSHALLKPRDISSGRIYSWNSTSSPARCNRTLVPNSSW